MRSTRTCISTVSALASLLVLLCSTAASAYSLKETDAGQVVAWRQDRVTVHFDRSLDLLGDHDEVERALMLAIGAWEESDRLTFDVIVADTQGAQRASDGHNDILAVRDWPYESQAPAVTVLTYDHHTGAILDADIVFNASRRDWGTAIHARPEHIDLRDIATHELGHLIGLDHSDVETATMYPEAPRGSVIRRTLHHDDLQALEHISQATGQERHIGCSGAPGPARSNALPLMLLIGLLLPLFLFKSSKSR